MGSRSRFTNHLPRIRHTAVSFFNRDGSPVPNPKKDMKLPLLLAVLGTACLLAEPSVTLEAPPAAPAALPAGPPEPDTADPKPLQAPVNQGLAWLAKTQNPDGGWGQGGGWRMNLSNQGRGGRVEGADVPDPSDLGNTAIVLQAFLRSGTRLDRGDYAAAASRAASFILDRVEKCDTDSLYVTDVRDTQLQSKIGRYVDTFLAVQILSDLKGRLSGSDEERRAALLDKVVAKIEKHQQDDGAFAGNSGWAATLSQGLCSNALNSAFAAGATIQLATLEKDHAQNAEGLDRASGQVAAVGGVSDAGVDIYRYAAKLRGMTGYQWNNSVRRDELAELVASPSAPDAAKTQAAEELKKIDAADADQQVLLENVAEQVKDARFVAGFGNNGGEEFISYMNIGEALRAKGGKDWHDWQERMFKELGDAQNADGSWAGQHCITGRTFCTATALMVLMTDRAPQPAPSPVAASEQDQPQEP